METGTFAFIAISLFMIHEFEEIIFVIPWIEKKSKLPRYRDDIWIKQSGAYPSAQAVALMIAEEFCLTFLLCLAGLALEFPELILGAAAANILHLLGHIAGSMKNRFRSPGTVTSAVTLPLTVLAVAAFLSNHSLRPLPALFGFAVSLAVLACNLLLLHKAAPRIHSWLASIYPES